MMPMRNITSFTQKLPQTVSILVGLFFVLVLHFKISYSLIPLLLSVIGLGLLYPQFKQRTQLVDQQDKQIICAFLGYFLLFITSLLFHQGRGSELDIPSRMLLLLPILIVCYTLALKPLWILYAILLGTATAGIVALIQFFILKLPQLFPAHMYIQAGDIITTLSLCCLAIAFYFQQQKMPRQLTFSLIAFGLGVLASLLNQARGAWVVAPVMILAIFALNRHLLSKTAIITLIAISLIGSLFAGHLVQKRWQQAEQEITQYIENNNGSTSVGARFDMWKSAFIGIQEKPLFGWGLQGVKEMRKQHYQQGIISEFASGFDHAHNQYLQDTSARGILGLLGLLAIFLVPLRLFWQNLKQVEKTSQSYLWGTMGIVHILSTMGYCLTQSFLSHNSGIMFYTFCTLIFYALQKTTQNRPLERIS